MNRLTAMTAAIAAAIVFHPGSGSVIAADAKPEKTQGLEEVRLQQFPLPTQVSAAAGYDVRGRRLVLGPGGTIVEHPHAGRPGIVYILEGSMTEHRGNVARVVRAGDTWIEDDNTVHWMENPTDKPCVFLSVDLIRK